MERRSNWRDIKEWAKSGLHFSTTSDEFCKLFDAALTQYVGWYVDNILGGLTATVSKLREADPTAVMGHVLSLGFEIMGSGKAPKTDSDFRRNLKSMVDCSAGAHVTDWEKRHVNAVTLMADGDLLKACDVWEHILLTYPLDMLAIKFLFEMHFFMGAIPQRRDSIARVLPHWSPNVPLYSYIYGMYSFSLCENNQFDKAETFGKKGLECNPCDTWATHALVHTYEMSGRYRQGRTLLESTVKHWEPQETLACHNYWHWALNHFEDGEYEEAMGIFDSELHPRTKKSGSNFNMSDCSSLLKRIEMEGVCVGERWQDIYEVCRSDAELANKSPFADTHFIMCLLGSKHKETARKMMDNIRDFINSGSSYSQNVKREVGAVICESMMAYDDQEYSKAVDLLYPIRYKIHTIGGSNAQRDVIHQFLIHAAMKSTDPIHNKLARSLLAERKALIENSPLTDRLIAKAIALH